MARLVFLKYKTDHVFPSFSTLNTSVVSPYPSTWLCLPLQSYLLIFIPSLPSSFPLPVPATLSISLPLNTPGSFPPQVFTLTISLLVELFFSLLHCCLLLSLQVSTRMLSSSCMRYHLLYYHILSSYCSVPEIVFLFVYIFITYLSLTWNAPTLDRDSVCLLQHCIFCMKQCLVHSKQLINICGLKPINFNQRRKGGRLYFF